MSKTRAKKSFYEVIATKFNRFLLVRQPQCFQICSSEDQKELEDLKTDIERRKKIR